MSLPSRLLTGVSNAATGLFASAAAVTSFTPLGGFNAPLGAENTIFAILRALYNNSDYADVIRLDRSSNLLDINARTVRGLRNPTFAVVEFYVATVLAGALPAALPLDVSDELDAAAMQLAAEQVWTWSNWAAKKQVYVRSAAMLGEVYLQVATKTGADGKPARVYLEVIQPDYINVYDTQRDDRGFVTRLRMDMPVRAATSPVAALQWHTELWDKDTQSVRYWTRDQSPPADVGELGTPDREVAFADMGLDFVPFVHVPFLDMGDVRGVSPVLLAYDKIIELDQLATSLHQALYRYNSPDKIIEGVAKNNDGDVPPPPRLSDTSTLEIAGIKAYSLPPGWTMHNDVAGIHYAEQLQAIEAHWEALRETNLPELYYWATPNGSVQESGRALESRLKGAISRATEARGNLETGLVRAMQMAWSVAQSFGLKPFVALGNYADGGMDFAFQARDVLPVSEQDELDLLTTRAAAMKTLVDSGASIAGAAGVVGFSVEQAMMLASADLGVVVP